MNQTRRRLLAGLGSIGAAGAIYPALASGADGALETTRVRITKSAAICIAPQYIAEGLLHAEGFTDVRYVEDVPTSSENLIRHDSDFMLNYVANLILDIDNGASLTMLAGAHVGCFELFGSDKVNSIIDLKGKSIGIQALGTLPHILVTLLIAQVGLDPKKDIHWVTDPKVKPIERFIKGEIDAFLGFPPEPQDLREQHVGHVLVSTALDRPWSQYMCCMLGADEAFVRKYPVATKRVVRAILMAADICASDPGRAAGIVVDGKFASRRDVTAQAFRDIPYNRWREYDAEDAVRFYALRLRDAGFIKSNPQRIIAEGTDWRYFNEVKRELKG